MAQMSPESASYVVSACRAKDLKFIWFRLTGIIGGLKCVALTAEEPEKRSTRVSRELLSDHRGRFPIPAE